MYLDNNQVKFVDKEKYLIHVVYVFMVYDESNDEDTYICGQRGECMPELLFWLGILKSAMKR